MVSGLIALSFQATQKVQNIPVTLARLTFHCPPIVILDYITKFNCFMTLHTGYYQICFLVCVLPIFSHNNVSLFTLFADPRVGKMQVGKL